MKTCSRCRKVRPETDFGPNSRSKDGLDYRCRPCGRERRKKQVEQNSQKWVSLDAHQEHPTGRKFCRRCSQVKFVRDFSKDRAATDGLQRTCRKCQVEQWQLSQYGCAIPDGARCEICTHPGDAQNKLGIDHCHQTGMVRGVLCHACNTALGLLQDDPERMGAAIAYVTRKPRGKLLGG